MEITFPSNTTEIIDAIRSGIGREVVFYTEYKTVCSACGINPITDTSTNPFCLSCSGEGYITTLSGTNVLAHITHYPMDNLIWVTGGQIEDGDVRLQIKYTDENWTLADTAKRVLVDDVLYRIKNKTKRGFQQLNRIIILCDEET